MTRVRISPLPFDSDALRANLANTAQEVVIPDRYLPLLEAVDGLHGVRSALAETMGEYFHTFRNAELLVDGFQTTLLRNWSYFERSPDGRELFGLLAELVVGLLESRPHAEQFSLLLRALLTWSCRRAGRTARRTSTTRLSPGWPAALARLLPEHEAEFLERDTLVRNLVRARRRRDRRSPGLPARCTAGFSRRATGGCATALDVPAWALSQGENLTDPGAVAGQFDVPHRATSLDAARRRWRRRPDEKLLTPSFPPVLGDPRRRPSTRCSASTTSRTGSPSVSSSSRTRRLGYRQKEVMVDLLGVVKQMMQPGPAHRRRARSSAASPPFFRDRDNEFLLTRFQCYEAIGVAIGEAGNVKAADHLIEDILYWRFQYPDIRGATDEWETVVNPYHLPKIRCWMHIIESNPALFERLAAALNVQLRLGGVFIADTDLFQRDVTRFLNADIRPIYFVAKQLLRTLARVLQRGGGGGGAALGLDRRSTRSAGGATRSCISCASRCTRSRPTGWWLSAARCSTTG